MKYLVDVELCFRIQREFYTNIFVIEFVSCVSVASWIDDLGEFLVKAYHMLSIANNPNAIYRPLNFINLQ